MGQWEGPCVLVPSLWRGASWGKGETGQLEPAPTYSSPAPAPPSLPPGHWPTGGPPSLLTSETEMVVHLSGGCWGSHKDLVCSSDLEEVGLPGSWPPCLVPRPWLLPPDFAVLLLSSQPRPWKSSSLGVGWGLCQAVEGSVVPCSQGSSGSPGPGDLLGTTWPREQEVCTLWAFGKVSQTAGTSSSCVRLPTGEHRAKPQSADLSLLLRVQLGPAISEKSVWNPGHLLPAVPGPAGARVPLRLLQASVVGRGLGLLLQPSHFGHHPSLLPPPLLPPPCCSWGLALSPPDSPDSPSSQGLCLCVPGRILGALDLSLSLPVCSHTLTVCLHSCPWNLVAYLGCVLGLKAFLSSIKPSSISAASLFTFFFFFSKLFWRKCFIRHALAQKGSG